MELPMVVVIADRTETSARVGGGVSCERRERWSPASKKNEPGYVIKNGVGLVARN
jgi:hypothetical protein